MTDLDDEISQVEQQLAQLQIEGKPGDEQRMLDLISILDALKAEQQNRRQRADSFEDVRTAAHPLHVKCPFCEHGKGIMPCNNLPAHVFREHSSRATEKHRCPICFLINESMPEKVVLVEHLYKRHGDMFETLDSSSSSSTIDDSIERTSSFEDVRTDSCPFDVKCPFCEHGKGKMPANNLPAHVFREHSSRASEQHRCPICFIMSETMPVKVNLVQHLAEQHGDMVESPDVPEEEKREIYSIDIPKEDLPEDLCCPYCLDRFTKGSETIIMWCFHRYHRECLEEWWQSHEEFRGKCMWKCTPPEDGKGTP